MVESEGHPERSLPPSELSRIDGICDRFEAAWEAGKEPKVDDYLGDTPEPLRSKLRRELTAIDRERRAKQATHSDLKRFVRLLVESRLMPQKQVEAFWASLPSERRPKDAQGLAGELIRAGKLTRYQVDAIFQGRTKGLVLGEYLVLDRIGAGGMGEVLRARHQTMERIVALKVLPAQAMKSAEAVERFRREVKAAARLEHPNIVTAYDAGEAEGVHFLVMQYVDGLDLAEAVARRGPLPVEEAVDYTIQAARGLEYAHRQGVVHRDIKPGNLLMDREGTIKILDMGLARMAVEVGARGTGRVESLTQSGQVMGTCDYMAPEQAKDTHRADHRADIYSLGCTLYRLLTGKRPYPGETAVQILLAHCQSPIPSVREARPEVSAELEQVLWKMMAKEPEDRQQSMGEVIAELEAAACPEKPPVQAAPVPPPPPPAKKESSTERKLTAFLRSLSPEKATATDEAPSSHEETIQLEQEAETGTIVTGGVRLREERPRSVAVRRKKRPVLLATVVGGVGLAVLIGLLSFLARPPREEFRLRDAGQRRPVAARPGSIAPDSYLLIKWPQHEREDAKLEIDGRLQSLSSPGVETSRDEVKVRVDTGLHKIWIARRGHEPFEERVKVIWGETVTVEPKWRRAVEIAGPAEKPAFPEPSEIAKKPPPGESETRPPKPEVTPTAKQQGQASAARRGVIDQYRNKQAAFNEAMKPVDERAAAWDFQGALAALEKVHLEGQSIAHRLPASQKAFKRLTALKARIIAALNAADPPLRTTALLIPGAGGDVVRADETGVTVKRRGQLTESVAWSDLGPKAPVKLVELVIDRNNADDLLAAALLALASGDLPSAEEHFEAARTQGAETGPYLGDFPRTAFDQALAILQSGRSSMDKGHFAEAQRQFAEADRLLVAIDEKHSETSWFESNKGAFDAALEEAKSGIYEAEAEDLFAQGVTLFEQAKPEERGVLFDLKAIIQKLQADYPRSAPVTDAYRKPSFTEMGNAVKDLGQFITVRQDGKGQFTSIQAAIDAAAPNSLIEIQDKGPYNEKLQIPRGKEGLTLRGERGCFPVVTSIGPRTDFAILVQVRAAHTTLERLVLAHTGAAGSGPICLDTGSVRVRVCSSILYGKWAFEHRSGEFCDFHNCLIVGGVWMSGRIRVTDSVWLGGTPGYTSDESTFRNVVFPKGFRTPQCEFRCCTIHRHLKIGGKPGKLIDCILPSVESVRPGTQIEHCDVYGQPPAYIDLARPGKGCFSANPHFRDPANLDYRLMPTSPCIGKASDGGDVGCRYTPEMIEMCKLALELRAKGIIKF